MSEGTGTEAVAVADVPPAVIEASERARCLFDCRGTIWAERTPGNGERSCHGDVYAQGAPDVDDCRVRIESYVDGRGYVIVPAGDVYDPREVNEDFLTQLGGGRRWKISLRHRGSTLRKSSLYFDTTTTAERKPIPGEADARPSGATAPAAPVGATEAQNVLLLGNDSSAAMIGSAVAGMSDPMTRFAFGLLLRDGERARDYADRTVAMAQSLVSTMAGALKEAARGSSSSGEVAQILRGQADAAARAAETAAREAREAREALHKKEVAEAGARGADAPNPLAVQGLGILERVATAGVVKLIDTAGPEGAQRAVAAVASTVGAAASAAG